MAAEMHGSPAMADAFNHQVRPLIDLIDRLRQLGLEQDVSLPSIAVVGDQSSGKSSVLEALSGVQLPRGAGIVTRCPLELRMKSCRPDGRWRGRIRYQPQGRDFDNDEDDFGVDEDIDDPNEIETRVRTAQNLLAGPDRGISSARITLDIFCPDVPDLTLIDLPGITRLVIGGQNEGISQQIRNMIREYIRNDATIILAVVPANVDIATTEALQMAREVDREGKRTLGVVTKPDLVDPGAEHELIEVISNARYQLQRGYTLVKCRGQAAINSGISLREALAEERNYFASHPHLSEIPEATLGMTNLSRRLTSVLVEHIKEHLPALKTEVRDKQEKVNRELAKIGEGLPSSRGEMMMVLTKALQMFTEIIGKIEDGDTRFGDKTIHDLNPHKLARISFGKFAEEVNKRIPLDHDRKFKEKIIERIKSVRGRELPRFISFQACEELVKEIVQTFLTPAKICLTEVNEIITEILGKAAHQTLGHYRDLEVAVKDHIYDLQQKARDACDKEIDKIFKQEKFVYTQDCTYNATLDSVLEIKHSDEAAATAARPRQPIIPKSVKSLTLFSSDYNPNQHLTDEAEHTFEMIISYMNVCGRRICDTVPMTILFHMVKDLCENIRDQIWNLLSEDPARLLSEEPETAIRREVLKKKADRLQQAQTELRKF